MIVIISLIYMNNMEPDWRRDEPCNKRVWMSRAGLAESDPSKEKLKVTRRRVTFRICRLLLRQTPLPQDRMLEIK